MNTKLFRPSRFWFSLSIPLASLVILLLLFTQPVYSTPAAPNTDVCGQITSNTTWNTGGSPYIVTCDVQVTNGTTLTIQPNVIVKFDMGTSLQVDGALIAEACTFTTNDPTPAKGDWGHIFFTASSVDATYDTNGNYTGGSKIQECLVEWGGGGAGVNGMIETDGASPLIDQNTIQYSSTRGIYANGRSATESIFISGNNISQHSGGGVRVSSATLNENNITNNSGGEGGGVYAVNSILENNQVNQNSSSGNGGGIYAEGGNISNNTVTGNTAGAGYGGGIYSIGNTLANNTVNGNSVTSWAAFGGGIYASSSTLINNTVNGNTANETAPFNWDSSRGGGIYASLSTLDENIVMNNTASATGTSAYGGGIYATGGTMAENTVTGNTATTQGGGTLGLGGGIYAEGGNVNNNTVEDNTATGGDNSRGGGIYGDANTIQANTLTGNSANEGGAIYITQGTVLNNTVMNNTATLNGAIYVDAGTATGNTLQDNSAPHGGGIYGSNATVLGNTIQNNSASIAGGGIYTLQSIVQGNTVLENDAQTEGGGIYAEEGMLTGNLITFNTVPNYGHGSGVFLSGNITFTMNTVMSNTASGGSVGGVAINGQPQMHYNNLYNNQPYDAEVVSLDDASATLNYWGESPCTAIGGQIYDADDLPGRGELEYAPSLYAPVTLAQLNIPANLTMTVVDTTTLTLAWSPIPDIPNVGCREPNSSAPDVGYRLYYDTGGVCTFDGEGLPAGNSPIDLGETTTLTLTGVSGGEFHFVVAAYDYLGRESPYSNEVIHGNFQIKIYLPNIMK